MPTMLYLNDSTHEESLVAVEPFSEADESAIGKYRDGLKVFKATASMEKLLSPQPYRQIGVRFDQNVMLHGRCGCGVIITDEQAALLREKTAVIRAERQKAVAAENRKPVDLVEHCWECGLPRKGRGDCPHCGSD